MAHLTELANRCLERGDDAVGLGFPGIRGNTDPQAASATRRVVARRTGYRPFGHRSNCRSPSRVSINAEQDSTQSPVLQYTVPLICRTIARCMWPQTIPS